MVKAVEEPEVLASVDRLYDQVQSLAGTIGLLEERLVHVSRQDQPRSHPGDAPGFATSSPLGNRLEGLRCELAGQQYRVGQLISQLAI